MTNFYEYFKIKARNKDLTATDMVALCVYKTIQAKTEDKKELLDLLIKKAFTPGKVCAHRPTPYQAAEKAQRLLVYWLKPRKYWQNGTFVDSNGRILGVEQDTLLTDEELTQIKELLGYE